MNPVLRTFGPLTLLLLAAACARPAPPRDTGAERATAEDPAAALRTELAAHRLNQIVRLHAYAEAGEFPHDLTVAPAQHMFRDASGRYCAVANLVHQDGRDDLVAATVRDHNDLAVADVHDGPMMDWILGSGLTQKELARIQLPAPYIPPRPPRRARKPAVTPQQSPAVEEAKAVAQMTATVRAHAREVEAELRADTDASLDEAVAQWIASHGSLPPSS